MGILSLIIACLSTQSGIEVIDEQKANGIGILEKILTEIASFHNQSQNLCHFHSKMHYVEKDV